eukprot:TRINITY_DN60738_c0_g1_i1.p1 TRINITY_DN60738_c0_g1~~TRINITY_DN60738_c0_g1_i1.p1  ORF type:complete len:405 (+),score=174.60 TRINITY_DN60738_c0_g1_i1:70-1215(+)
MSRVRTESMIQRLAKKPLSEGFDLWDKDYLLGALRLFQCKLESSPPFEVAPCLEAIATLLAILEEYEDAIEHYTLASDKYHLIHKKHIGEMMKAKAVELKDGPEEALKLVDTIIASGKEDGSAKEKMQLGCVYTYRADLCGKTDQLDRGVEDALKALSLGPGRMEAGDLLYLTHNQLGQLYQAIPEKITEADKAFTEAVTLRPIYFQAIESLIPLKRAQDDQEGALQYIESAYELHPKAGLLREKAFLLSELGRDDEGIKVCDDGIADPPHEETEALTGNTTSVATLYKAKAAILADAGRLTEARDALQGAISLDTSDAEAVRMAADISTTLSRDYLASNNIPQFLDALVTHVLQSKPADPCAFMVEAIENNKVPLPDAKQ